MTKNNSDTVNEPFVMNEIINETKHLLSMYINKKYDALSQKFIDLFLQFSSTPYFQINSEQQTFINLFTDTFLYIFTKPDYVITPEYFKIFISLNNVIANIAALSYYKNTDIQIELLKNQENSFLKILILYSARNTVKIDRKILFDEDSQYASAWYINYFSLMSYNSELTYNNILEHLDDIDDRFSINIPHNFPGPYFVSSYYGTDNDKKIKQKINGLLQQFFRSINVNIKNTPDKTKIGIITLYWLKNHAVYKTYFDFINALKNDYELTLVHLGDYSDLKYIDTTIFKHVKYIPLDAAVNKTVLEIIDNNDFGLVYYPDTGMNKQSICLSNLRIAPVQVAGYGHPVSTYGSEIDYFIGGSDIEILDAAQQNYSERLIVIPGLGVYPVYPAYEKGKIPSEVNKDKPLIINCPWTFQKVNYKLLLNLQAIIKSVNKKIIFRFFPGEKSCSVIIFKNELSELLGEEHIEVIPFTPPDEYMRLMEEGDITIDSYPFGGYNTGINSIYLNKPLVTFEGSKACNRLQSAFLRKIGLDELIATNEDEYIDKVVKLVNDDSYRLNLCDRISNTDWQSKIFNTHEPEYFKKAIDYLIENHDRLKSENSKSPIIIPN